MRIEKTYCVPVCREIRAQHGVSVASEGFRSESLNGIESEESCCHVSRRGNKAAVSRVNHHKKKRKVSWAHDESGDHCMLNTSSWCPVYVLCNAKGANSRSR